MRTYRKNRITLFLFAVALFICPLLGRASEPFALIGDSHIGRGSPVYAQFIKAVEMQKIKKIIHLGDAIDAPGSAAQWKLFFDTTGPDKILHLAPGNHDINGRRSFEVYQKFFPASYYSFADNDTLFLILNTELPGEESRIAGEQLAWVEGELTRTFRYKLVFMHEPLFGILPLHSLDRHPELRDRLHRLFVEGGVCLVFSAHDHAYKRSEKDGITYVISGGGGGYLMTFLGNNAFYHYTVSARTQQGYSFTVTDMEGKVRDRFTVKR
jgi:acid phosphatase type 7